MYNFLKSTVKNIIPRKVLIGNEERFRRLLIPLYRGKKHQCLICGARLKSFARLENGNLICPVCGSLPRTRRLYRLLHTEFLKPGMAFMDFSPSRMLYKKWKARKDIAYFPTDFENEFLSDYRYDITCIEAEDEKFDLIACYHILEHITEDRKAMAELYRVLKENGTLLVQTPFKEGEAYENDAVISKEERLKHFGQEDHVRIYSVKALESRLRESGFQVTVRTFSEDAYHGLSAGERILVCTK